VCEPKKNSQRSYLASHEKKKKNNQPTLVLACWCLPLLFLRGLLYIISHSNIWLVFMLLFEVFMPIISLSQFGEDFFIEKIFSLKVFHKTKVDQ
jgi:hypothetical protein